MVQSLLHKTEHPISPILCIMLVLAILSCCPGMHCSVQLCKAYVARALGDTVCVTRSRPSRMEGCRKTRGKPDHYRAI